MVSHISQKTSEMWGTQGLFRVREGEIQMTEPWLRGTLTDLPVVQRALLHSLEMAAGGHRQVVRRPR